MAYTTIDDPGIYFNTVLYTGNYSTQSITGVGFQPDWVWIKERSVSGNHQLQNSVNGTNSKLMSNSNSAEGTDTNYITSFDSDGFSLGANNGNNQSGVTNVAWNWKAGTSFSNDASSTGIGSIDSSGSFNNDAGFSIVSFVGTGGNATVKHGLNSAPAWIIFKDRSASKDWFVYHQSISPSTGDKLNNSVNPGADSTYFQNTATTSSVFSVGSANTVNASSNNMVAFCFSEKKGYSKFGSYTGNGNSSGTFIYTGFRPAWIMTKGTSTNTSWDMHDTKRDTFNVASKHLLAEDSGAEGSTSILDILSNGFKYRSSNGDRNASTASYMYMAFAESPFVNSKGVPTNAR